MNSAAGQTMLTRATLMLKSSQDAQKALPVLVGVFIVTMNTFQLWMLNTKFSREINPLLVMMKHLCIADLLNGILLMTTPVLSILEWKVLPGNMMIHKIIIFLTIICGKYVFSVSTLTLNCLTVFKMMKITRNKWYSRATIRKICTYIWFVMLFISTIDYSIFQAVQSSVKVAIQRTWVPVLLFPSIVLQICCYGRILCYPRAANMRFPAIASIITRCNGKFLKIAIFQMIALINCMSPLSLRVMMVQYGGVELEEKVMPGLRVLTYLQAVIDPIVFIIVYRKKLRPRISPMVIRYDGRAAFVLPRPKIKVSLHPDGGEENDWQKGYHHSWDDRNCQSVANRQVLWRFGVSSFLLNQ